ncbi:nuclear transport factor 2 family protein [Vibrio sonorensis]|uniref:nuclear transport factor 2 family protein n=1 Tax=Vibrio sonorensis TaxID=1004316 RepID=UPI0008DA9ADA|nr:nuclear transport factor 2 family protein [Vibrio sonorensis]
MLNPSEITVVEEIKRIDSSWETALNEGDRNAVEQLLHPDFVWVHNKAEMIQNSKADFLEFFRVAFEKSASLPRDIRRGVRRSRDVTALIHESTAVVFGYVDVKRPGGDKQQADERPVLTFHFMRTYVKGGQDYQLISNHTMLLSEEVE